MSYKEKTIYLAPAVQVCGLFAENAVLSASGKLGIQDWVEDDSDDLNC